MIELRNEQLTIKVAEKGAELQSIKDASGKERSVAVDHHRSIAQREAPAQKEERMMEEKFNIKTVKVHRTTEAMILEVVFVLTAIIVWGIIIWMIHQAPDIVPTHFDASGKPNAYGSPIGIAIPCIIMTIAGVGLMVLAYFPRFINMPVKITNIHQVELTIRSTRIAAITLLLLALATVYTMLGMPTPSPIPILAAIGLLFLEIIVFSILIYKAK